MGLEKTVGYSSHKFLIFVSTADDSCQTPTDFFLFPFNCLRNKLRCVSKETEIMSLGQISQEVFTGKL